MKILLPLLVSLLLLSACSQETPPPLRDPNAPPLVVYTPYEDTTYLPALFKLFTDETGIPVVVRHLNDEDNLAAMADKSGSSPADVLLTGSVWSIWRAAEDGLLRPLPEDSRASIVADGLKDPDGQWVALSVRGIGIQALPGTPMPAGFLELADPAYAESLCVTSGKLFSNQVLAAFLMHAFGEREAELAIRGWVKNLALPPFDSDADMQRAFAEGRCRIGIRTAGIDAGLQNMDSLIDMEGLGIGRHARSPDEASVLIDWMLSDAVSQGHAGRVGAVPAASPAFQGLEGYDMNSIGMNYEDAGQLLERAGYR